MIAVREPTLIAMSVVLWTVTVVKIRAVLSQREKTTLYMWLFAAFLALGATFFERHVYNAVHDVTGINNLSWYLASMSMSLSIFYVVLYFFNTPYGSWSSRSKRTFRVASCGAFIWLTLLFWFHIPKLPNNALLPDLPSNDAHVTLYLVSFFGYILACSLISTSSIFPAYKDSQPGSFDRLRAVLGIVCGIFGISAFTLKISYILLTYYLARDIAWLNVLVFIAATLAALAFSGSVASNDLYRKALHPLSLAKKLVVLWELTVLQKHLADEYDIIELEEPTWRDYVRDVDYYLYRAVMNILDANKQSPDPILETVEGDEYEALIQACVRASRKLRS